MAFEDRDIRKDPRHLEELLALGARATPVTVITDGDDRAVIHGFNQGQIAKALKI